MLCNLGWLSLWFAGAYGITRYISHVQNYVNLVSSYYTAGYSTVDMPPVSNVSQTMKVNIDVSLFALNGFDEVAGNIELVAALNMSWTDQMPLITSVTFNIQDRDSFLVPYEMIWTPKLVLTNAIGDTSEVGDPAYLCRFNMRTNIVIWRPRIIISGSCTPDITYYPFDKQTCSFIYTAWGFTAQELVLETNTYEWDTSSYQESGEWELDTTKTTTYIDNNQSYMRLTISIVRKPLYFAFNIVIPVLVLCLLNGTVFLLPAESGERVGFSVTCFLSFVVLLNMIMDILPRSSNPISFLCYYLVVMMCISGAMTLVTILLMRVYHKPEKTKVPKWMQRSVTFINCGCARLKCCVRFWRALAKRCSHSKPVSVGEVARTKNEDTITSESQKNDTERAPYVNSGCFVVCKRNKIADADVESGSNKESKIVKTTKNSDDIYLGLEQHKDLGTRGRSLKSSRSVKQLSTAASKPQGLLSVEDQAYSNTRKIVASKTNLEAIDNESISSDASSLNDVEEEEVKWSEVGRICDTFFFLVFIGGQTFFTVVFLVPLFTGAQ